MWSRSLAARADIEAAIELAGERSRSAKSRTLVGLAGSVTTVAAMALDLPTYLPERIHHARIPVADVRRVTDRLLAMTHDERAALPFMHPGRVDVIGAGALVLSVVLEHVPVDEVVRERARHPRRHRLELCRTYWVSRPPSGRKGGRGVGVRTRDPRAGVEEEKDAFPQPAEAVTAT